MISRRLFQAALNLKKYGTPEARRAFADALVHNKRVVDRFYKMHTNFNKASYNSLLNSYDPRTLRLPGNRTYPLATPKVTPPNNLRSFLGDDAYKAVLAQHRSADDLFRASNKYLDRTAYFTNNLGAYLQKPSAFVEPPTPDFTGSTAKLLSRRAPDMDEMYLPGAVETANLLTRAARPGLPAPKKQPLKERLRLKRLLESFGL